MGSTIEMYDGKVWGVKVSDYGLEHGYLDYRALARILEDCIHNDFVRSETAEDWVIISGELDEAVHQDYIISKRGYEILRDYTDELVFYNEKLDLYVWGVTHFGTSWDYVLTDIKLVEG